VTAFRSVAVAIATSVIAVPASGQSPSDGDWPIVSKDYANTRFSELAEITAANVATLKVAWNDPTPQPSSQGVAWRAAMWSIAARPTPTARCSSTRSARTVDAASGREQWHTSTSASR